VHGKNEKNDTFPITLKVKEKGINFKEKVVYYMPHGRRNVLFLCLLLGYVVKNYKSRTNLKARRLTWNCARLEHRM
jgi:hypothetical protein